MKDKRLKPGMDKERKDLAVGVLFVSPATLGFLIFTIGPMLISLYYSFTNYDGVSTPLFVGLENY